MTLNTSPFWRERLARGSSWSHTDERYKNWLYMGVFIQTILYIAHMGRKRMVLF